MASTIGRLVTLPADVLESLRLLPSIAENTAQMADATAVLPEVRGSLAAALQVLETMDRRMATIESAMPVLVEVQQHLARVPDTLERLDDNITVLSEALNRLLQVLADLDSHVGKLQGSIDPLSRVVQRLPGGGQRS